MTFIDFNARAELYLGSDHASAQAEGARNFRTAAHALRFALEEAAPVSLRGARLFVGSLTFTGNEMAALYRLANYPLARKNTPRRLKNTVPAPSLSQVQSKRKSGFALNGGGSARALTLLTATPPRLVFPAAC